MKPLIWIILIFGILLAIGIVGASLYMEIYGPPVETKKWSQLRQSAKDTICALVEPNEDETYLYYYSAGLFDFSEDGNLVTDQRVVSYFTEEDGEFYVSETYYEDIADISFDRGGHILEDSTLTVHHYDSDYDFDLWFSTDGNLDSEIAAYIRKRLSEDITSTLALSIVAENDQRILVLADDGSDVDRVELYADPGARFYFVKTPRRLTGIDADGMWYDIYDYGIIEDDWYWEKELPDGTWYCIAAADDAAVYNIKEIEKPAIKDVYQINDLPEDDNEVE